MHADTIGTSVPAGDTTHEEALGRTCMSATEKTDIQEAEATGLRSPPNRPAPLAV
jgi:hypothetical protein